MILSYYLHSFDHEFKLLLSDFQSIRFWRSRFIYIFNLTFHQHSIFDFLSISNPFLKMFSIIAFTYELWSWNAAAASLSPCSWFTFIMSIYYFNPYYNYATHCMISKTLTVTVTELCWTNITHFIPVYHFATQNK